MTFGDIIAIFNLTIGIIGIPFIFGKYKKDKISVLLIIVNIIIGSLHFIIRIFY